MVSASAVLEMGVPAQFFHVMIPMQFFDILISFD